MNSQKRSQEISHVRAERAMLRFFLGGMIGLIFLIGAIWGGLRFYNKWQEKRLIQRAYRYYDEGDLKAASLTAQHILELRPGSVNAARVLALLAERVGEKVALDWRRKVVQSVPDSMDDQIALARTALQFGDTDLAEATLNKIQASARDRADYHALAGSVAQVRQQIEPAITEWTEAERLAPANKDYQLQLAMTRLQSADAEKQAKGLASLIELRNEPNQRVAATRAVIVVAINRRENASTILQYARELQAYPEATLKERLVYLDLLRSIDEGQFTSYLTDVEKIVANKPGDVAPLLAWMSQSNLNLLAVDFMRTLPPETLGKWPIPLVAADISVRLSDWSKLQKTIETANWKRYEFLRHAYLARAFREQGKSAEAEREWNAAAKAAAEQADTATMLTRTASEWGWTPEAVDLLWTLSKRPEKQKEAYQTLYRHYAKSSDTQGLYRVLVRLAEIDPNNLDVRNNLAQISLLLNAQVDQARLTAADVYRKEPANPAYAMTYAYSLLTKGDAKGALKVISSLPPEKLQDPAISAYYGLCLASARDDRAREFLEKGKTATLLPEEKALIEAALSRTK